MSVSFVISVTTEISEIYIGVKLFYPVQKTIRISELGKPAGEGDRWNFRVLADSVANLFGESADACEGESGDVELERDQRWLLCFVAAGRSDSEDVDHDCSDQDDYLHTLDHQPVWTKYCDCEGGRAITRKTPNGYFTPT